MFGAHAGENTTTGGNAFFGTFAGQKNNTGSTNVFIGMNAGKENLSGSDNIYVGFNAGGNNQTGNNNIAIGSGSIIGPGLSNSIVLTQKRLVAFRLRDRIIDVPLDDPRLKQMDFTFEEPETLAVCFDANLFQPDWKGRIEYRFHTPAANEVLDRLTKIS